MGEFSAPSTPRAPGEPPWYKLLSRYHWFVMLVAALGWLFDCLDQQLFVLARPAAMKELLQPQRDEFATVKDFDAAVNYYGSMATSVFLVGWATGGLFFGVLGDRIGRAKTMMITILLYSLFTGLSSLSTTVWDFALYRFLTGLGVGGEFAVGVALVAEVMPERARAPALTLLQMLSAIGNITAALINMGLGVMEEEGLVTSPWRKMFLIGALPALLALLIRAKLKEPERWTKVSHDDAVHKQVGSYSALFGDPTLRKHALLGLVLSFSGVVGLWAVGFFTPDLTRSVMRPRIAGQVWEERLAAAEGAERAALERLQARNKLPLDQQETLSEDDQKLQGTIDKAISGRQAFWGSMASIGVNIGAFLGMFGFGFISHHIGRKPTFAIAFIAAGVSTFAVFKFLDESFELWMVLGILMVMGFCQLSLFAGYAVYFPELFPTRLRSTGTSFCYNVGRFIAATGPVMLGLMTSVVYKDTDQPFRYAGMTMCSVFLVGLLALPFAPETRGQPLPE